MWLSAPNRGEHAFCSFSLLSWGTHFFDANPFGFRSDLVWKPRMKGYILYNIYIYMYIF